MTKGYWVACVNVKNQEKFKKYVQLAGPAINMHGGEFLIRGNKVENLEGKKYQRIVVSVFKTTEKAKKCYYSKEYQYAKSFLGKNIADRIIHIVEGLN